MSLLGALVEQQLAAADKPPEPENPLRPPPPPKFDWLPVALDFMRARQGREVLTCEIHSYIRGLGKVPNPKSMTNTLDRAIKDGRAKGLSVRVEMKGRGCYRVAYWKWTEPTGENR